MAAPKATAASADIGSTLLRDVIEIPRLREISDSDLVLSLSEAVADDAAITAMLRDYVLTDQLVDKFDEALSLVKTAITGQGSKAAYLHGSFGSGKSHFMAVLYGLLRGNVAARSRPEFAPLLAKHESWLGDKNVLMVPYHMLGAKSLEQRVLGGYVAHIQRLEPNAPTPQVYRTDALFEDIRSHRIKMGDEAFIKGLPGSAEDAEDEWGDAAFWTSEKLDIALAAAEPEDVVRDADLLHPKTPSDLRAKLVNDAIEGWFPGFTRGAAENQAGFISLDRGLSVIAEHAKSLGYDTLVLFLDELILWLASAVHDTRFIATETQKITNFVEGGDVRRAVPVVSFIARQRDLKDFVGESFTGSAEASIQQTISLAKGRFDVITLEDRNLPEIARVRVLKRLAPETESEAKIAAAFANIQRVRPEIWDILIGTDDGTTGSGLDAFRKTYPFSPAFMDTLVHVSNVLQRNRTGLKLMRNLLAEHRDDFRVGQLVPIGDLYGELTRGGDAPFTEEKRAEFKSAQKLYQSKLRPQLLEDAGLTDDELDAARLRPDQVDSVTTAKIARFTTDDRLMRTLLLSALAPTVPAFKGLTAKRLNALNHGFVRTNIRGQEDSAVLRKVTEWSGMFPEIKVGPGSDPSVGLELVDVDYESVLDKVKSNGSSGNVKALVKRMLWEEFGVEEATVDALTLAWHGSQRRVEMLWGNIADKSELRDDQFAPNEPGLWRFIIDMPFDEGRGPADDHARLNELREAGLDEQVIAWVPAHFTASMYKDLVTLTIIEWLLTGTRFQQNSTQLPPDTRERARAIITSQRDTLRNRVRSALRQAYGLAEPDPAMVGEYHHDYFVPLTHMELKRPTLAQPFEGAIRTLADGALTHQFPAHPDFDPDKTGQVVRPAEVRKVFGYLRQAFDEGPDDRVEIPPTDKPLMRRVAERLHLGTMHEANFELSRHWADHFEQRAAGSRGPLRVADLRRWIDEPRRYGLDQNMSNLVIAFFADQTDRVWTLNNGDIDPPEVTAVKDGFALRAGDRPDDQTWEEARTRAAKIFGYSAPKLNRGRLVNQFAKDITEQARELSGSADVLVDVLEKQSGRLGIDKLATDGRLHTARLGKQLLDALLTTKNDVAVLKTLAAADLGGPAEQLGKSVKSAKQVAAAVTATAWDFIEPARGLAEPFATDVEAAFSDMHSMARGDELVTALAPALQRLRERVVDIQKRANAMRPEATPAPPMPVPDTVDSGGAAPGTNPPTITPTPTEPTFPPGRPSRAKRRSGTERGSARQVRAQLNELAAALDELNSLEPDVTVELSWRVVE